MSRATFRLMPDPSMLPVLHLVVRASARQQRVGEDLVDDIRIGASEAVAEAIAAHGDIPTDEPVVVELEFAPATVDVRVSHAVPDEVRDGQDATTDRMAVIAGIADRVDIGREEPSHRTIAMRWRQDDTRV